MRDLVRAREAAVDDLRRKRQVISSLLLKHGRVFPGKKTWGATYVRWLQGQSFTHPAQQVVLQEMVLAERHARERLARIEAAIAELLPSWSLALVVEALQVLQALRGIRVVTAATIMVDAGDLNRFESARQFMGYLGLVPGERSTGNTVCTAPGSLDKWLAYAARLKVCSFQAAGIASGLRWPFFSISHSAL